ncbi:MAG: V-type ATP synthase subunit E [Lachnospiraceae bacterium]|nr:V-type ATP synthase subunit E [Lachnospiraceae bacterium]
MTLEEKIEHLQSASMELARSEGNNILADHKAALDQIFEDHKTVALRQAELSVKAETNNGKQQINKAMAKSQTDLKRDQGNSQTKLKSKLFDRVRVLLGEFMNTPEYEDVLVKYILQAKHFAGEERMTVYINPSDEALKETLEAKTGVTLTISKEDFMGGARAVIHERNILIDHSFLAALDTEYDKFLFSGGEQND